MSEGKSIRLIVILSDGIRGHLNQSRGVALWLSGMTGAEILETEVPILSGAARTRAKAAARKLVTRGLEGLKARLRELGYGEFDD